LLFSVCWPAELYRLTPAVIFDSVDRTHHDWFTLGRLFSCLSVFNLLSSAMIDSTAIALGAALLALSSMPTVAAEPVCTEEDEGTGKKLCGNHTLPGTMPKGAQIAIAIVVLVVVLFLVLLVIFVRRSRRQAAESKNQEAQDVSIEPSQMTGPPAILHATYTPETGHSRVYSIGPDTGGFSAVPMTPAPGTPAMPMPGLPSSPAPALPPRTAQPIPTVQIQTPDFSNVPRSSTFNRFPTGGSGQPPKTAPAHKGNFDPYPFTGHGSTSSRPPASPAPQQPPRTAFVSSGGFPRPLLAGRLKDRIRERPPSVSSLNAANSPK